MAKKSRISVIAFSGEESPLLVKRNKRSNVFPKARDGACLWVLFIGMFCLCLVLLELLMKSHEPVSRPCAGSVAVAEQSGLVLPSMSERLVGSFPSSGFNFSEEEISFWKQPDDLGYRPCLNFSKEYRDSQANSKKKGGYLIVVVNGGLNQQRNQIVDAVVIARILGATLVVPILQVNLVWEDESEFSDIFDVERFKRTLKDDVRIVTSLPSTHLTRRPLQGTRMPFEATPDWIKSRLMKQMRRDGVLLIKGLDSRLSKDLPQDLQKLRCKVAFEALKFAKNIESIGNRLAERISRPGPYMALHLRMEKDVWVRTGCNPSLDSQTNDIIERERRDHPYLLTSRRNMTASARRLAGLCPLNAAEVARLLKALGAPSEARIYWAGGEPLGGKEKALKPLKQKFPFLFNKFDLALPGELDEVSRKASVMAAIDYIVCLRSHVFMASHGGNMGRALQGHRAYSGHRKHILPNKREIIQYIDNKTLSENEFAEVMRTLHSESMGHPASRTDKSGRDVLAYPVPECMCRRGRG